MVQSRRAWVVPARVAGIIALIAAGVLLLPRPLTSVAVLVGLIALAPAAAGALAARRFWRRSARGAAVASGAVGLALTVALASQYSTLARALPFLLAAALVARAVVGLVRAVRPPRAERPRTVRIVAAALWLLAAVAAALLAVLWPDLATLLAGALLALALIVGAVVWAWRVRPRARARGQRSRHPLVSLVAGVVVAAVAVVGAGASLSVRAETTRIDAFYSYDGAIPAPGTLLRAEPYEGALPDGASALRILYASTYADGSPALASALVAIPTAPADAPRPVMAWQHGTTGIAQSCGPSLLPDALSEESIPGIGRAIERGWVVVATDYPGQGTAGRYPYLIGEGEARATWDAVRAAQSIDETDASDDVLLWGHSQGGHATLWAGQIAEEYAPEQNVVAVAALSAASDPLWEARVVTSAGVIAAVVTPYLLVPYADEYDDISLADTVHPAGHGIVAAMGSRCAFDPTVLASAISAFAVSRDAPLFTIDLERGAARDRLAENIATGIVPAPLFLGQGTDDEVIPIDMQRALAASLGAAGRDVEAHEYPGRSHMGVLAADSPLIGDLFDWVDGVLAERRGTAPTP